MTRLTTARSESFSLFSTGSLTSLFSTGTPTPTLDFSNVVLPSAGSPEETLKKSMKLHIDRYVTERRHPRIRFWHVSAEGLVSPARTAPLRVSVPTSVGPLEWVSCNLADLRRKFSGQWIAVSGSTVVASAPTLALLLKASPGQDQEVFVTQIPVEPVVWQTAYAD